MRIAWYVVLLILMVFILGLHIIVYTGSLILQDNVLDVFNDLIEVKVGFSKKKTEHA